MDLSTILDPITLVVTTASVVGAVQLVKEILNAVRNFKTDGASALEAPLKIVVAALVGAVIVGLMGSNPLFGIVAGLSASGIYKLASNIG